jgi:hypothetical protein
MGIDTEADDQWSSQGRAQQSVRNAERLPALQALCDRWNVRPTYLVTHEMATKEESAAVLRDLARGGRCEIGTHLHPWSSPPFRAEDLARHTYPHNLPDDLLARQIEELTTTIAQTLGVRPVSYRAGRNGLDGRTLGILERLHYSVDTSVDPLFNERRKGGRTFAGAPIAPYFPDSRDVCREGAARILEIPITSATQPHLPKALEAFYTRLPPLPYRGYLKRLGLRPVWLRPSYSSRSEMIALATRLAAAGQPCLNLAFHSSELLPGGSPYSPDEASVTRFLDDLEALLEHSATRLGARGQTYAEFATDWRARTEAA